MTDKNFESMNIRIHGKYIWILEFKIWTFRSVSIKTDFLQKTAVAIRTSENKF